MKIARAYTKRAGIVAFTHAFHGRTFMAMTLTNRPEPYKNGFVTRANDVYRAEYPYLFRNPWGATTEEELGEKALAALKNQVSTIAARWRLSSNPSRVRAASYRRPATPGGLAEYAAEIGAL